MVIPTSFRTGFAFAGEMRVQHYLHTPKGVRMVEARKGELRYRSKPHLAPNGGFPSENDPLKMFEGDSEHEVRVHELVDYPVFYHWKLDIKTVKPLFFPPVQVFRKFLIMFFLNF